MHVVAEQWEIHSKLQIHLLSIDLVRLIISASIYTSKSYGSLREDVATRKRLLWERMQIKKMSWSLYVYIAQLCSLWLCLFSRQVFQCKLTFFMACNRFQCCANQILQSATYLMLTKQGTGHLDTSSTSHMCLDTALNLAEES